LSAGRLQRRLNERPLLGSRRPALNVDYWVYSDLSAFREFERVLHIHAKVAHRIVDLSVTEQDLLGPQIAAGRPPPVAAEAASLIVGAERDGSRTVYPEIATGCAG
jgi:hypothetical protein